MCNVGCKLVACGDAHTFTVTLIKNFLYNRSPLMADECQRDAAIGVLELVCSMLLLSDTTTMCQFPSQVIPQWHSSDALKLNVESQYLRTTMIKNHSSAGKYRLQLKHHWYNPHCVITQCWHIMLTVSWLPNKSQFSLRRLQKHKHRLFYPYILRLCDTAFPALAHKQPNWNFDISGIFTGL